MKVRVEEDHEVEMWETFLTVERNFTQPSARLALSFLMAIHHPQSVPRTKASWVSVDTWSSELRIQR